VHIRWLRQKIETDPDNPKHLVTVRGTGYKLEG
jgi:DNA-binding response OmpR family regulator